ncbi:MAG: EFR1 family ferrodoxin [Methanoregula sp.]|nr:EFR1 family ferrodoxin [Methanoregula sp.]
MKTIIYYFTGTGNSLAAAKRIGALLGDTRLVPIASLKDTTGPVVPDAERVGIVCPVYDSGVPVMVAGFAGRLDISRVTYTFAVVTMGGTGISALHQLSTILSRTNGRQLNAGFAVKMPGNFPPLSVPPTGEKKEKILAATGNRFSDIASVIRAGTQHPPGFEPVSAIMKLLAYGGFSAHVHDSDTKFSVDRDTCTSCGICAKVCPAANITLVNDLPSWNHRCEMCLACLHWCPVEAIQFNVMRGTRGRGRYRHPDLRIADMIEQREGRP